MDNIHIFSIIALAFLKTRCLQECLFFYSSFLFPSVSDRWFACLRHAVRSFLELCEKTS